MQSVGKADLPGVLSDYAADAVLFTPEGPLVGKGKIGPLFQAMFAEFAKPGASFTMTHQSVEGDYAYLVWSGSSADYVYEFGTDTFVVRDGKIVAQTTAWKKTPRNL
jgi:ketosteroid isomerase-like protein